MYLTYRINNHIKNVKCEMCHDENQHDDHILCIKGNDFHVIGNGCKKICNNLHLKVLFHDIHNYPIKEKNINQSIHQYIQNKIQFSDINDILAIKDDVQVLQSKKYINDIWIDLINDRIDEFKSKINCTDIDSYTFKMLAGYKIETINNILSTCSNVDIKERIIIYLSNK